MVSLVGPVQTPAATGGAGTATATIRTTSPVRGRVLAVYVKYLDAPPATTDVTVATSGTSHPLETVLSVSNAATDGWYYPKTATHLNTSGAVLTAEYGVGVPVHDTVDITIAQANDGDAVQVWMIVE